MAIKRMGTCYFCHREFTGQGILRHLQACSVRADMERLEAESPEAELLYHMRVGDAPRFYYWLDLEIPARAQLWDLDRYLRYIWLECCWHLSIFDLLATNMVIPMSRTLEEAISLGMPFVHTYDMGHSTVLDIKVLGHCQGRRADNPHIPLRLMSRNLPYTEANGETAVNSPRWGVCAYEGPAEAPVGDYPDWIYVDEASRTTNVAFDSDEAAYAEFLSQRSGM